MVYLNSRIFVACGLAALVSGCGTVASNGPLTSEVIEASYSQGKSSIEKAAYIFDVVDVDPHIARTVSAYKPRILNQTFGMGKGAISPRIGVGDKLEITIFEAGPDGLFSTAENKATTFSVVVQPDGNAPIPYVGSFRFAGNSLEAARRAIANRLKSRAVEPDVIISLAENTSRSITVNGAVGRPSIVEMSLIPESIMSIIAKAGGSSAEPHESYVTLTRGGKSRTALMQNLIKDPDEDIFARPGDKLFITKNPQTFSVLGSVGKPSKIQFGSSELNLIEAAALASGSNVDLADPKGFFVFRYEYLSVIKHILGETRVDELIAEGLEPNSDGLYPMVYRINLSDPGNLLLGQTFAVRDKDLVYLARHPSADFQKFIQLVVQPIGAARSLATF